MSVTGGTHVGLYLWICLGIFGHVGCINGFLLPQKFLKPTVEDLRGSLETAANFKVIVGLPNLATGVGNIFRSSVGKKPNERADRVWNPFQTTNCSLKGNSSSLNPKGQVVQLT